MTETFVKHLEMPKEERLQLKLERKNARRPALYHWFGLLPFALNMFFKRNS